MYHCNVSSLKNIFNAKTKKKIRHQKNFLLAHILLCNEKKLTQFWQLRIENDDLFKTILELNIRTFVFSILSSSTLYDGSLVFEMAQTSMHFYYSIEMLSLVGMAKEASH